MQLPKPVEILAIGAHPDDIELSCSGTLLKHKKLGRSFALVDLTMGQLGSRGSAALRLEEARNAAELMGADYRHNLGWEDGFFEESEEHLLELIREIRLARPRYILANAISDRHPDHGRAGALIRRATFLAGLVKVKSSYEGQSQAPHRPVHLLHYIQDRYIKPDVVVDITAFYDMKLSAISCYKSQFFNPESEEPDTPISSREFWDYIEAKDRYYGRMIGCKFGEGFVAERTLGVERLDHII